MEGREVNIGRAEEEREGRDEIKGIGKGRKDRKGNIKKKGR